MGANQQEVRVRLSAEGMAEVVSAFQRVSAAGKQSAKETGDAFAALNKQFSELGRSLLGGVTILAAAGALKSLLTSSMETAEGLTRLSQVTGLSTQTIQGFQRAARETGISAETANGGLSKLTLQLGKAEIGSLQSALAVRDLGLSVKDLQNLNADQKFLLIAQRLASIPDQARQARDATALFGRGVLELLPAIIAVGRDGIDVFVNKLRELGVFLDDQAIAELKQAKDRFRDLGDEVKGLGMQFLLGLVPSLSAAADGLTKATGGGEGFRKVGEAIGWIVRNLATGFEELGLRIGAFAAGAVEAFTGLAASANKILRGDVKGAIAEFQASLERQRSIVKEFEADRQALEAKADKGPEAAKQKEPGAPPAGGAPPTAYPFADQLAKARLQLTQQMLDNELKLFQAHSKLQLDEEKGAYQQGLISLEDYYARRREIISAEYDKQIEIARKKLAAEQVLPAAVGANAEVLAVQRQAAQAKLKGQIADLEEQRRAALQTESTTLQAQELSLMQREASAAEKLLTLEGDRADAARIRLALEAQALDNELAQGGVAQPQRQGAVSTLVGQGGAAIDYDEASRAAKAEILNLDTQKKAIQDQVNAGQIFEISAQQQILELEQQKLPILQADAQAMLQFANASKDPQLIAQAEAFKEKIQEIAVATDQAAQQMKELRAATEQAVGGAINTFLTDAISKGKTLGQSFHAAMLTIEQDLVRVATKMLTDDSLRVLFGGDSSGKGPSTTWLQRLEQVFSGKGGKGVVAGADMTAAFTAGGTTLTTAITTAFGTGATALTSALVSAFSAGGTTAGAEISAAMSSGSAGSALAGAGEASGAASDAFAAPSGFAEGGHIIGPGTSTSDSIPIMASAGEHIINAKAASQNRSLLNAINSGIQVRHFATGGQVSIMAAVESAGAKVSAPNVTQNFHINTQRGGAVDRLSQTQIGAEAMKGLLRAHQKNN